MIVGNETFCKAMQIVRSGIPMERIATYILDELPETENSNKYVLAVSDTFTKWIYAFPMQNMEADTVASIIIEEVIARFRKSLKLSTRIKENSMRVECPRKCVKCYTSLKRELQLMIQSKIEWDFGDDAKCLRSGKS